MTDHKLKGGPKTIQGKLKVAKNAIKHGLSTMKPSDAMEKASIERFSQELIAYYQPSSPLELFQIERIAICRVKLSKLYETESARLELAKQEILNNPKKVIENLTGIAPVTCGMLLEECRFGQTRLPCDLTPTALEKIVVEITYFSGQIHNGDIFAKSFPSLVAFLKSRIGGSRFEGQDFESVLLSVSRHLEYVFQQGMSYHEHLIYSMGQYSAKKGVDHSKLESIQAPEDDDLERHIQAQQAKYQKLRAKVSPARKTVAPKEVDSIFTDHQAVMEKLQYFIKIWECYHNLEAAKMQFEQTKDLMLRALALPPAESDLLMRYQTTLERRLSSLIGELLALQKNPLKELKTSNKELL
jgi:hypothetical protein